MSKVRVLLAGESWVSHSTHHKGWDFFSSTVYETGIEYLEQALLNAGFDFHHMPSHIAAREFPLRMEGLKAYDVIILSDIGANTLLLHPDTWTKGQPTPNRLKLIRLPRGFPWKTHLYQLLDTHYAHVKGILTARFRNQVSPDSSVIRVVANIWQRGPCTSTHPSRRKVKKEQRSLESLAGAVQIC